jgi:O-antigen/teichoic acid export membrane protein
LESNKIYKNILMLITGGVIAQLILFVSSPIIARIYSPADLGFMEKQLRLIGILSSVFTLRLENALLLSNDKETNKNIVKSIASIVLVFVAVYFVVSIAYIYAFANTNFSHRAVELICVLLITVMYCVISIFTNYNISLNNIKHIYTSKIIQNTAQIMLWVALAYFVSHQNSLLIGLLLSSVVTCVYLLKNNTFVFDFLNASPLKIIKQYPQFPTINLLHSLMDGVYVYLFVFLIEKYYGTETLGLYAYGLRIMQVPLGLIAKSVSQTIIPEILQNIDKTKVIQKMITTFIKKYLMVALPLACITVAILPWAFKVFLGGNWENSGRMILIVLPFLVFSTLSTFFSQLPIIYKKQQAYFLLSALYSIITLIGLYACSFFGYIKFVFYI